MPSQRRGLMPGEIALAREAFGDRLPYERISFVDGAAGNPVARLAFANGNGAITLRRTIHFGRAYYRPDFAVAKPAARGLFIHELTHVWQYQELGTVPFLARYAREFGACGLKAWRMYRYDAGQSLFATAWLEAQAEMAGNYAEARAEGDQTRQALIARNLAGSTLFGL